MTKTEIRNVLDAHKEHYRVLPTLACQALFHLLQDLDADIELEAKRRRPKKKAKKK